jgi:hypothetical protein
VHDELAVRRLRVGLRLVHLPVGEQVLLDGLREPLLDLFRRGPGHDADDETLADCELRELLSRHGQQRAAPDQHEHNDQRDHDAPIDHGAFDDASLQLHSPPPSPAVASRTATPSASIGVPDTTTAHLARRFSAIVARKP